MVARAEDRAEDEQQPGWQDRFEGQPETQRTPVGQEGHDPTRDERSGHEGIEGLDGCFQLAERVDAGVEHGLEGVDGGAVGDDPPTPRPGCVPPGDQDDEEGERDEGRHHQWEAEPTSAGGKHGGKQRCTDEREHRLTIGEDANEADGGRRHQQGRGDLEAKRGHLGNVPCSDCSIASRGRSRRTSGRRTSRGRGHDAARQAPAQAVAKSEVPSWMR